MDLYLGWGLGIVGVFSRGDLLVGCLLDLLVELVFS